MKIAEENELCREEQINNNLWTRNFLLVCFVSLLLFFAFNSLIPTLPLYMERYGQIPGAAGLPLAALSIGAVLSRTLTGWVLDAYGRRAIFWGGLLLFLAPSIIFIGMIPATFLIFFRFIQGVGWGVAHTALNTVASDNIPAGRMGEGIGFYSLTFSLPMAVAPAFGLWMLEEYSFPVLFLMIALVTGVSMVLSVIIKYPDCKKTVEKPKLVLMDQSAIWPAMVMLLFCLGNSAVLSFLPVFASTQGLTNAGLFFTVFALTSIIWRPVCGILIDRMGSKGYDLVVLAGIVSQVIAMLVVARTTSVAHFILGGCFFGIGLSSMQLAMLSLSLRNIPWEKRGAANAAYWTAFDLGMAAGSIVWGMVAAAAGFFLMFHLTLIPVLMALAVYFLRKWRGGGVKNAYYQH